jgi:hypothetical protein
MAERAIGGGEAIVPPRWFLLNLWRPRTCNGRPTPPGRDGRRVACAAGHAVRRWRPRAGTRGAGRGERPKCSSSDGGLV